MATGPRTITMRKSPGERWPNTHVVASQDSVPSILPSEISLILRVVWTPARSFQLLPTKDVLVRSNGGLGIPHSSVLDVGPSLILHILCTGDIGWWMEYPFNNCYICGHANKSCFSLGSMNASFVPVPKPLLCPWHQQNLAEVLDSQSSPVPLWLTCIWPVMESWPGHVRGNAYIADLCTKNPHSIICSKIFTICCGFAAVDFSAEIFCSKVAPRTSSLR